MSQQKISLRAACKASFLLLAQRPGLSMLLGLASMLLFDNFIFLMGESEVYALRDFIQSAQLGLLFLFGLGLFFLFLMRTFLFIPLCKLSLDAIDNPDTKISFILPSFQELIDALNGFVLSFLYTILGLSLLIIPGFIVSARLSLFLYALVDAHLDGPESLRVSWDLTRGNVLRLLLFSLFCMVLNFIAVIPYGLGLLISMPFELFATAHLYRQLKKK